MGIQQRRDRDRAARRATIVDAAERVFLSKGLAAATMSQIAQQAEVSKGTLYLYFKNKDDLYLAIALRVLEQLAERFEAAMASEGSGYEQLLRMTRAHQRFALEHPDRFRVSLGWLCSDYSLDATTPGFARYQEAVMQLLALALRAIQRGQQDGSVRAEVDAAELALQLWSGQLGTLLIAANAAEMARRLPVAIDWRRVTEGAAELALNSVAAPERPAGSVAVAKELT